MRTPGHDPELAAGFLLAEGLIGHRHDILEIAHCQQGEPAIRQNILNVFLRPEVSVDFDKLTRHVFASSSCGICGKASIDAVHQRFPPVLSTVQIRATMLLELPARLRASQKTFDQTGGLHAAAVFDSRGELLVVREDVGRHNAVDKAIGFSLLKGLLPMEEHLLLVSGRASFEILQKALSARIPVVAAISAPSSLAVQFARESGQTLVGFLRGQSMNVYSRFDRIAG
jgi:FdhD protein